MKDHKLAGIELTAVLHQMRVFKSALCELKSQILYKRTADQPHRREMFAEDDLVLLTLVGESNRKLFGLIRSGERITDKLRLHKSLGKLHHCSNHRRKYFPLYIVADHPDVKIQPPVWFCHEYNIRIFGNGIKIVDGSQLKIQVTSSEMKD